MKLDNFWEKAGLILFLIFYKPLTIILIFLGVTFFSSHFHGPCIPIEPREFINGYIHDSDICEDKPEYRLCYRAKTTGLIWGKERECKYSIRVTKEEYSRVIYKQINEE